jgi:hypothetical protein
VITILFVINIVLAVYLPYKISSGPDTCDPNARPTILEIDGEWMRNSSIQIPIPNKLYVNNVNYIR